MAMPLHPHNAHFSFIMVYTHAILVPHWSLLTHLHITCFPVIPLSILSMARCICPLHPPGSLQVKAIYYIDGGDKGVNTFPKGISLKVKVIVKLEFKLAYFEASVQQFSHYIIGTPLSVMKETNHTRQGDAKLT